MTVARRIECRLCSFKYFAALCNISGNIDCIKKADHILEMPEPEEFCDFCFKNHGKVCGRMNVTNKFKVLRRLLSSFAATVMFRETLCI